VIQSFGDKDAELLFKRERIKRLPPDIQRRARNNLLIIYAAADENDLIIPPGNRFEKLKGDMKGWCSIRINEQWKVVFKWAEGNACEVKITEYH
jgi:proteic killer suppression protein